MKIEIYDRKIGKEKTQQNQNLTCSKDPKTVTCQENEDKIKMLVTERHTCTKY